LPKNETQLTHADTNDNSNYNLLILVSYNTYSRSKWNAPTQIPVCTDLQWYRNEVSDVGQETAII